MNETNIARLSLLSDIAAFTPTHCTKTPSGLRLTCLTGRFNSNPASWWNKFYKNNAGNFFKDRKWLQQEFPILTEIMKEEHGPVTLLEVGAGAGNTAFPILNHNRNPSLKIHACDYSKTAVDVMRNSDQYNTGQIGVMQADFWDAASADELPPGLTEASVDIVMMIFIFSALEPFQWDQAVRNIYKVLKPGGLLCFRDYGHGDLAQVRFKKGRYMEENFYVRGDGTRVYFFKQEDLTKIWTGRSPDEVLREDAHFEQLDLGVDRRLIVNRSKQLKMYRCWMQGRFQKPVTAAPADSTSPNPTT